MKAARLSILGAALTGIAALTVTASAQSDKSQGQAKGKDKKIEAVEVGEAAPDFTLVDLNGDEHTLSEYTEDGKVVVLEWFSPGCPFVVKHHENNSTMKDTFGAFAEDEEFEVVWLAINSANEKHKTADAEWNNERVEEWEIAYPVLVDQSGDVGKAYGAKTTPHMFVIDADGTLVYSGAIDSDSGKKAGETNYVADALASLKNGETVEVAETKPYGCGVKY